jgi:hypothetical protein
VDIEVCVELSREDLARLTVLGAADPLAELQSAAHRLAFGRAIDAAAATGPVAAPIFSDRPAL